MLGHNAGQTISPNLNLSHNPNLSSHNLNNRSFGYNMAALSVELFGSHEAHKLNNIILSNTKLTSSLDLMEKLNHFIALFNKKSEDSERVVFDTAEEKDLLDDLRNHEGLRNILPQGVYEWKGKTQIENIRNQVADYLSGPLQAQVNTLTQGIALEQHELTQVLHMFQVGLHRMLDAIRHINQNISRSH